ncbi:hypothetical protein CKO31_17250 [Thiohalocapsa halophila]|uniref:Nucleotidyltransferase family protein n=1 Tax=Thiohalocapsa halophila TaxID=69359 RepID=A0ABS1CKN2_9GAMM|nr:nucleotidyltransferase family protein [Thiohalocapsa halophila]MBK1632455.1 hypothetical protein [Thiohalocapsa halophila]
MFVSSVDVAVLGRFLVGEEWTKDDTRHCSKPEQLLSIIRAEGVAALCYEVCLNHAGGVLSVDLLPALRAEARRCAIREMRLRIVLRELFRAFRARSVPAVCIKGVGLAYTLYDQPYHRPWSDLDLVVPEGSRAEAARLLEDIGYTCTDQKAWRRTRASAQATFTGGHEQAALSVDLHWQISNRRLFRDALSVDAIIADSVPLGGVMGEGRTACTWHAFVIALMHRATNHTAPYYIDGKPRLMPNRLIWLYDIYLLYRRLSAEELASVSQFLQAQGLVAVAADGLNAVQDAFGVQLLVPGIPPQAARSKTEPTAAYLSCGPLTRRLVELRASRGLAEKWGLVREWLLVAPEVELTSRGSTRRIGSWLAGFWAVVVKNVQVSRVWRRRIRKRER